LLDRAYNKYTALLFDNDELVKSKDEKNPYHDMIRTFICYHNDLASFKKLRDVIQIKNNLLPNGKLCSSSLYVELSYVFNKAIDKYNKREVNHILSMKLKSNPVKLTQIASFYNALFCCYNGTLMRFYNLETHKVYGKVCEAIKVYMSKIIKNSKTTDEFLTNISLIFDYNKSMSLVDSISQTAKITYYRLKTMMIDEELNYFIKHNLHFQSLDSKQLIETIVTITQDKKHATLLTKSSETNMKDILEYIIQNRINYNSDKFPVNCSVGNPLSKLHAGKIYMYNLRKLFKGAALSDNMDFIIEQEYHMQMATKYCGLIDYIALPMLVENMYLQILNSEKK
jgi:hypothetical protein